ncbi:MAG: GntR family transcriptional regulator [Chloroflexi bacterium]|nr:GntR family transcriptional regulator [Chloroflexota bacterium]
MTAELTFPRINSPKISEVAYDILREKIVSKQFAPGERLDLNEIEKSLGISRTPLKEALSRLEMEGLIQILPRSGTHVTKPSVDDIAESFDLRRILERYAVELMVQNASDGDLTKLAILVEEMGMLAKQNDIQLMYPRYLELDHEFHRQLVALSGNQRLREAHERENLHAQMSRIRYRAYERELSIAQEEHERIIAALLARNLVMVAEQIDAHLKRAKRSLLSDMATTYPSSQS